MTNFFALKKSVYTFALLFFLLLFAQLLSPAVYSQAPTDTKHRFVIFPYPMDSKWRSSLGVLLTTMPEEITEEIHYRIPAIDLHVNRKITRRIYLDGRINSQLFQNFISIGPRWAIPLSDRFSVSVGDDIGWWIGFVNVEGFKSRGNGWQNYPNASAGFRFRKSLYLTLKTEAIMNLGIQTRTGDITVKSDDNKLFSGGAITIALEQPFYGKKSLTLGFRAIYTNFFWQTWALFETFDRNIFYPQIIVGLVL